MEHTHSANCGCKEYAGVENSSDLYPAIDLQGVHIKN
jgi:hypothetical protein